MSDGPDTKPRDKNLSIRVPLSPLVLVNLGLSCDHLKLGLVTIEASYSHSAMSELVASSAVPVQQPQNRQIVRISSYKTLKMPTHSLPYDIIV